MIPNKKTWKILMKNLNVIKHIHWSWSLEHAGAEAAEGKLN